MDYVSFKTNLLSLIRWTVFASGLLVLVGAMAVCGASPWGMVVASLSGVMSVACAIVQGRIILKAWKTNDESNR